MLSNPQHHPTAFLRELLDIAIARAHPMRCLAAYMPKPPSAKGRTLVLGAGKAGGAMAQAFDALWPQDAKLSGLVVTRYDYLPKEYAQAAHPRIEVVQAAHPLPDAAGMNAAARMLELAQGLTADDLVVFLISGGGSSLLSLPAAGLTLADKRGVNQALLQCGATIAEMNCVRKHLSAIKGGRLAALCAPARVVTLAISDVPGDDPTVIASGPSVPDPSTCEQALDILKRYAIPLPASIEQALAAGSLETPKPGDARFAGHQFHCIATPMQALQAAAAAASEAGLAAYVLSDEMQGESREVGKVHAALARFVKRHDQPFASPCVILSGGETTVTVRGKGRGGRATEFLLASAIALQGEPDVYALAADTDGIDGVESNAGAFITPNTLSKGQHLALNAQAELDRNNATGYFAALDDLVVTGPTFTNVNDFRALLVL